MIEYKVKPVTRFIITRFHRHTVEDGSEVAGVDTIGEYSNESQAGMVAGLMAHSECADIEEKWRMNTTSPQMLPDNIFAAAICELTMKAETLENNAPIYAAEGKLEQAKSAEQIATSCRQAISLLQRSTN